MQPPLYYDPAVQRHLGSPDGVESAARLWTIERLIRQGALRSTVPATRVGRRELERVHDPAYIDAVYARVAPLDDETTLGEGSITALEAAASCAWALGAHLSGPAEARGLAIVRPPGHHAGRASGGGYCIINNVMVAAQALFDAGRSDVAIIDLDAHFPDGTTDFVRHDSRLLLLTLQQSRLFPRDGTTGELDEAAIRGCVSVPLDPGAGDADLLAVTTGLFVPLLRMRRPQCLLVSLGVDAHVDDVTTDLRYSTAAYVQASRALDDAAHEIGASLGFILEGGYDPGSVGAVVGAIQDALTDPCADAPSPAGTALPSTWRRVTWLTRQLRSEEAHEV